MCSWYRGTGSWYRGTGSCLASMVGGPLWNPGKGAIEGLPRLAMACNGLPWRSQYSSDRNLSIRRTVFLSIFPDLGKFRRRNRDVAFFQLFDTFGTFHVILQKDFKSIGKRFYFSPRNAENAKMLVFREKPAFPRLAWFGVFFKI